MFKLRLTSETRIVDSSIPFTVLQQRLRYARQHPQRSYVNLVENIPRWPELPPAGRELPSDLTEYAAAEGDTALIGDICDRERALHGVQVSPEQVLVTNGGMQAASLVFRALARDGAVALCQAPLLGSMGDLLRQAGFRLRFFATENGRVAPHALEGQLGDVRLIYVNSPQNPTGETLPRDAWAILAAAAAASRAALVADAVYDTFVFDDGEPGSPLQLIQDGKVPLFVINSMSKNYGMPGLRVGWVISRDEAAIQRMAGRFESECISVSGPAQRRASGLLRRGNAALVEHVRAGRSFLRGALRGLPGVHVQWPPGGTQLFVDLPVHDVEVFGDRVLIDLGLIVTTAAHYEGTNRQAIRLPTGAPRSTLEAGLALLARGLEEFQTHEAEATQYRVV